MAMIGTAAVRYLNQMIATTAAAKQASINKATVSRNKLPACSGSCRNVRPNWGTGNRRMHSLWFRLSHCSRAEQEAAVSGA